MTPKEKAKELFDKMKGFRVKHSHSKKCALIAVDEVMSELKIYESAIIYKGFWEQVKNEIKLL